MNATTEIPYTSKDLIATLDAMDVAYTIHHHEPVFTVEESEYLEKTIPGTHCRNMFLRDKKKNMFLVTLANETLVDLKKLPDVLDCGRISFGSSERLWDNLGIRPGSVNPFCIVNDKDGAVRIILDKYMMEQESINVHPMDNAMTIGLAPLDLTRFIETTNHECEIVDLSGCAPDA
jgi:Ala-tRNA(Pro) deacylase